MRASIRIFIGAMALLAAEAGHAQNAPGAGEAYPVRPVRIIVPFGAGGPGDLFARLMAQKLAENLGKPFYIENHPGAGGNIGTGMAARSPADGYTLVVVSSTFMINPSLYAKIPYDPIKDFDPISIAVTTPNVLVVNRAVPATTVKALIELVRAGKYTNYAMPGAGTPPHMSAELFKQALKLDLDAVPFGGGGPMIASVIAGHTPIAFSTLPPAASQIQDGTLRALAVTSATRVSLLPEVPTLSEAGVPGQEVDTPQLVLAPAGTPKAVVDLLYREIARIVVAPELRQRMAAIGFEPVGATPEQSAARIRTEIPRWAKVVHDADIRPE
jgi:tripartite-type tricarboxylate transporter receptor subunit TctC